jgi:O-methyltransferase
MRVLKEGIAKAAGKFGVKLVSMKTHKGVKEDMDPAFAPLYDACKPYTLIHVERMYSLYKAVQYIVKKGVPGDFVECGVWKGGASMMMAKTLLKLGVRDRKLYLYDTFEGMTKPTPEDTALMSGAGDTMGIWERNQSGDHNEWCYGPLEGVKKAMEATGYPPENIIYVKGPVEETLPKTLPGATAILRLDTDFYSSTKHEMEHLFPLLVKDGVLIVDDYGYWAGARKAVDEYLDAQKVALFLHRDDYSGATGIRN